MTGRADSRRLWETEVQKQTGAAPDLQRRIQSLIVSAISCQGRRAVALAQAAA